MILVYFLENVENFEWTFHINKIILRFLVKTLPQIFFNYKTFQTTQDSIHSRNFIVCVIKRNSLVKLLFICKVFDRVCVR